MVVLLQIVIALGIYNVWLLRFNKATAYRGGAARNMAEEFAAYGLPMWFMRVVMVLKLTCATLLLIGIWIPGVAELGALGMVLLMTGAVVMHAKVKDPVKKTLPAAVMLAMSIVVALSSRSMELL
jgi:uncharacterized membrane protein YphA (DoxX/SURF4 family)